VVTVPVPPVLVPGTNPAKDGKRDIAVVKTDGRAVAACATGAKSTVNRAKSTNFFIIKSLLIYLIISWNAPWEKGKIVDF
jgi:hypothetical protein